MKDLDQNIRDFYLQKELSEDSLQRILRAGQAAGVSNEELSINSPNSKRTGSALHNFPSQSGFLMLVASVVLAVSLIFYFPTKKLEELVYTEVAMNHSKQLDVEFKGSDYRVLAKAMTKLDFSFIEPSRILDGFALIGARYCSIQGDLAAQLKLRNSSTGNIDTLYITSLTSELKNISSQQFSHKDVAIEVWQEDNLFYALASDNPTH